MTLDSFESFQTLSLHFTHAVLLGSFIVPLALLSIQPHQEPRFLVPLVVPLALLASGSPTSSIRSISNKRKRYFVVSVPHSSEKREQANATKDTVAMDPTLCSVHGVLRIPPSRGLVADPVPAQSTFVGPECPPPRAACRTPSNRFLEDIHASATSACTAPMRAR